MDRIGYIISISLIAITIIASPQVYADQTNNDESKPESAQTRFESQAKEKIAEFSIALQRALMTAVNTGGLKAAVEVCESQAPLIAEQYSTSGWQLKRTSLKTRNSNNKPTPFELLVLNEFEDRYQKDTSIALLEHYSSETQKGVLTQRFLKAIPMQPLCLNCHGESLAAEVVDILERYYPDDMAKGYKLDAIRGAFVVEHVKRLDYFNNN